MPRLAAALAALLTLAPAAGSSGGALVCDAVNVCAFPWYADAGTGCPAGMEEVAAPTRSANYTLRTADSDDASADPTVYTPGKLTQIHLRVLHPDAKYIGLLLYAVRDDESYVDADDLLVETKVGAWEQLEGAGNAGVFHAHSADGCGDAALTHYSADRKLFHHVFQWRAPNASVGTVSFRALVKWGETQGGAFFWPNAGGDLSLAPAAVGADDDAASAARRPAAAPRSNGSRPRRARAARACAAAGRACSGRLAARVARGGTDAVGRPCARTSRARSPCWRACAAGGGPSMSSATATATTRRRQRRRLRGRRRPRGRARPGRPRTTAPTRRAPAATGGCARARRTARRRPRRRPRPPAAAPTPVPSPAPTPAPTLGRALVVVDTRADAWVRTKANKLTENHGTDTLLWVCAAPGSGEVAFGSDEKIGYLSFDVGRDAALVALRERGCSLELARATLLLRNFKTSWTDLTAWSVEAGAAWNETELTGGNAPALVARVGSLVAPVSTYYAWAELDGVARALLNASDGDAAAAVGADAPRLSLAVRSTLGCNQKMYAREYNSGTGTPRLRLDVSVSNCRVLPDDVDGYSVPPSATPTPAPTTETPCPSPAPTPRPAPAPTTAAPTQRGRAPPPASANRGAAAAVPPPTPRPVGGPPTAAPVAAPIAEPVATPTARPSPRQ